MDKKLAPYIAYRAPGDVFMRIVSRRDLPRTEYENRFEAPSSSYMYSVMYTGTGRHIVTEDGNVAEVFVTGDSPAAVTDGAAYKLITTISELLHEFYAKTRSHSVGELDIWLGKNQQQVALFAFRTEDKWYSRLPSDHRNTIERGSVDGVRLFGATVRCAAADDCLRIGCSVTAKEDPKHKSDFGKSMFDNHGT